MPFLDDIVSSLNSKWVTGSLRCTPASKIKTFGITETILEPIESEEKDVIKRYPATVDSDGEAHMVDPNDDYHITIYHRVDSITNSIAPRTGFGDSQGDQFETANMSLIVMAFRDKVRKTAHWLEAAIKDGIQENMKLSDNDGAFMQASVFRIGNSSFDKLQLLSREYSEVELSFPNLIVFEMKYRIESTWKKGCFMKNFDC